MAKKTTGGAFSLSLNAPGVTELSGTLVSYDHSGVRFKHKKPRSSKILDSFFPMNQVVVVMGDVGSEESWLAVVTPAYEVTSIEGVSLSGTVDKSDVLLGKNEDYPVVLINPTYGSLTAEEDGGGGKRGRKKGVGKKEKSDKKGKKKKGKKSKGW